MAVHFAGDPAGGFKPCALVGGICDIDVAVDGDRIVVPEDDQAVELHVARERDRFLADAFHQAAIANNHIRLVVNEVVAEARIQMALCHRHADGGGDALAKRACGRLNAFGDEVFRVARRIGAQLTEIADVVPADRFVPSEVQQRIDQHRAVARRQNEPVSVRPVRLGRVKFQEFPEQYGCSICHAERQANMT